MKQLLIILLLVLVGCQTTKPTESDKYLTLNAVTTAIDAYIFANIPMVHKISGTRVYDASYTTNNVITPIAICIIVTEEYNNIHTVTDNIPVAVGRYYYINGKNVNEVTIKDVATLSQGLTITHDEWVSYNDHK